MIFVSNKAKHQIQKLKREADIELDGKYFLRISVVSGGCSGLSYKMDFDDTVRPDDQVFEDKGIKLVTDMKSMLYLFETTLEFADGLDGKGFHFVNPNAARTCGCGESFAL